MISLFLALSNKNCGCEINDKTIAAYLGGKGGKKSKRGPNKVKVKKVKKEEIKDGAEK